MLVKGESFLVFLENFLVNEGSFLLLLGNFLVKRESFLVKVENLLENIAFGQLFCQNGTNETGF